MGVSCVNALSDKLEATIHRDGKVYYQEYHRGKPTEPVKVIGDTEITGTIVTFKPDNSIFTVTRYAYDILASRIRELAFLNKGIIILESLSLLL